MRNWIGVLIEAYRRVMLMRETRRQLYGLSDHMLRDIGLRRDQISLMPARRLRGAGHETHHRPYLARAHDPRQG
jgi:uncharacterized protein YjiS (DUF1127 family)